MGVSEGRSKSRSATLTSQCVLADARSAARRGPRPGARTSAATRSRRRPRAAVPAAAGGSPSAAIGSARIRSASARWSASAASPSVWRCDGYDTPSPANATSWRDSGGSGEPAAWRHRPVAGSKRYHGSSRQPSRATSSTARDDVVEHGLADEVVEVHPDPARLDPLAAARDLALEPVRGLDVDPEQPVAVRPGARAAAARLDPEQVVEHRDDEVVVEVPPVVADRERHDRQPRQRRVAEDLDLGLVDQDAIARSMKSSSRARIVVDADRLLELEDEPGPDRLDDRRRAALLAMLGVVEVDVLERVDVGDGAAARRRRARGCGTARAGRRGRPACPARR